VKDVHGGDLVRMIQESSAKCRSSPFVLARWIRCDVGAGLGQAGAMAVETGRTGELFCQSTLEIAAPARAGEDAALHRSRHRS